MFPISFSVNQDSFEHALEGEFPDKKKIQYVKLIAENEGSSLDILIRVLQKHKQELCLHTAEDNFKRNDIVQKKKNH